MIRNRKYLLPGFEYQIALGDTLVPLPEFRKLVSNLSGILKIKNQYVFISPEGLKKLFSQGDKPSRITGHGLLRSALSEEYEGAKVELSPEVRKLISGITKLPLIEIPAGLTANLRPYQLTGYRWMVQNSAVGFGSLIADDMGPGKIVQVIAAILRFKQMGALRKKKVLVIMPTTLLTNWQKEIEKFAPSLTATVYHGSERKLGVKDTDLPDKIENNHYCILGKEQAALYQNVLNRAMEDMEQLDGIQCKGLVLKMITGLKQICNHPDNYLKQSLANLTVAAGEKWIGDLTNSELREIFRLE